MHPAPAKLALRAEPRHGHVARLAVAWVFTGQNPDLVIPVSGSQFRVLRAEVGVRRGRTDALSARPPLLYRLPPERLAELRLRDEAHLHEEFADAVVLSETPELLLPPERELKLRLREHAFPHEVLAEHLIPPSPQSARRLSATESLNARSTRKRPLDLDGTEVKPVRPLIAP